MDNYKIIKEVGHGTFGVVWQELNMQNGEVDYDGLDDDDVGILFHSHCLLNRLYAKLEIDSLEHLKIPFIEIYSATRGFDDNHLIGAGGFGGVYTAELFHVDVPKYAEIRKSQLESSLNELSNYPRRKGKVAIKRLESTSGQGRREFLKEIDILSGLYHQNLISLVRFSYEYGEMILVYDYASNGIFDSADSQLIVDTVGTPGYVDPIYLTREVEDEKFKDSVKTYAAITRECLHSTETRCLTMVDIVKQLKRSLTFHLIGVEVISLKEIKATTNCFSEVQNDVATCFYSLAPRITKLMAMEEDEHNECQVHIENQFHVQHLVQVFKSLWQLSMLRCSDELRIRASLLYRTSNGDVKHYIGISLCACGDQAIADASLLNFLRQVCTFRLSFVRLDIRQESDHHTNVIDAITKYLEIG
ncbi:phloem protein 2-like protein [Tanacetum coccineum]